MNKNEALGIIYDNIRDNKSFGSLFQFWKTQIISELEEYFPEKESDYIHKVAVSIVKRIAQDSSIKMEDDNMETDKMKSFEEAVQPLFKWMEENCTPHDKVIVDTMNAELVSGEIGIPSEYNRKINNL